MGSAGLHPRPVRRQKQLTGRQGDVCPHGAAWGCTSTVAGTSPHGQEQPESGPPSSWMGFGYSPTALSHLHPWCRSITPLAHPWRGPVLAELRQCSTSAADRHGGPSAATICLCHLSDQFCGADAPYGTFAAMLFQHKSGAPVQCQVRIAPYVIFGYVMVSLRASKCSHSHSLLGWEQGNRGSPLSNAALQTKR